MKKPDIKAAAEKLNKAAAQTAKKIQKLQIVHFGVCGDPLCPKCGQFSQERK